MRTYLSRGGIVAVRWKWPVPQTSDWTEHGIQLTNPILYEVREESLCFVFLQLPHKLSMHSLWFPPPKNNGILHKEFRLEHCGSVFSPPCWEGKIQCLVRGAEGRVWIVLRRRRDTEGNSNPSSAVETTRPFYTPTVKTWTQLSTLLRCMYVWVCECMRVCERQ